MSLKRLRGSLLRFLLKRRAAITLGLVLTLPAAWLLFEDLPWETPVTDGLALIVGATGVAFLLAGIGGRRPDWIE
jgi:putative flippase GtrA